MLMEHSVGWWGDVQLSGHTLWKNIYVHCCVGQDSVIKATAIIRPTAEMRKYILERMINEVTTIIRIIMRALEKVGAVIVPAMSKLWMELER